jgi:3,4-dihydroxy 2-butanone 4-phosphate synthase/GTP cyclohydrolase II
MAPDNTSLGGTAFTVSIDVKGDDVTTGISAYDRAQTIRAAIDPSSYPEDFRATGAHLPASRSRWRILERRKGQTEAAVDLASLAGCIPLASSARSSTTTALWRVTLTLIRFCKKHNLVMITVANLARHRFESDFEGALGHSMGYSMCVPETL